MTITVNKKEGSKAAMVAGEGILVKTVQDAMDLLAEANYNHGCTKLLLKAENLAPEFFQLRTGLAGEILQKFTNYHVRAAIVGDFSGVESKALRDFIRESNRGSQIFFLPDEAQALEALHGLE